MLRVGPSPGWTGLLDPAAPDRPPATRSRDGPARRPGPGPGTRAETPPLTYDQLYERLYGGFAPDTRRFGGGLTLVRVSQDAHDTVDPAVPHVVLRLVTGGTGANSTVDIGEGRQTRSGRAGSLSLCAPGADAHWTAEGPHDLLLLAVPEERLGGALTALYGRELRLDGGADQMREIWKRSAPGDPASDLLGEGLAMTLLARIARDAAAPATQTVDARPLHPARVQKVRDWLEANLSESVTVDQMADIAGQSRFHFTRAFKAATGQSPAAWAMSIRIERARVLLAGDATLAQIAYDCGFASQAHLTTRFRQATGTTPGAVRRAMAR